MADAKILGEVDPAVMAASGQVEAPIDQDPAETSEWLGSLDYVIKSKGPDRARYLVKALENRARRDGVEIPIETTTPYVNTIPAAKQPPILAIEKSKDASRASFDGTPWPWSFEPTRRTMAKGATSAPSPAVQRFMKLVSTTSSEAGVKMVTVATSFTSKVTLPGNVLPSLPRRSAQRREPRKLPTGTSTGQRPE